MMPACFVWADQPQAGFRGTAGQASDTDLDTLAGFPSGIGEANKIIGIDAAGTAYEKKTFSGTANQITLTPGVGTLVFSAPQNIHTGATPTFAGSILSAALRPSSAGATTLGTTLLPFSSAFIGASATNNFQVTGTATAARTVTLPDADTNTLIGTTATANQFLTNVTTGGVQTKAQPAFTNISGVGTIAQGCTNNGSLGVSALGIYTADGSKITQVTGTASQQVRVNAGGTAIEFFTASAGSGGFTMFAKSGSFSANDSGSQNFYRNSATGTITLPAATGSGVMKKFLQTSGTGTFAFTGGDNVRHASGTSDTSLTQTSTVGTIELIDGASGVWDET